MKRRAKKSREEAELEVSGGRVAVEAKSIQCRDHDEMQLHPLLAWWGGDNRGVPFLTVEYECKKKTKTFTYGGRGESSLFYEDGSSILD